MGPDPFLLADGILPDQFHALGIADPSIWPRGLLREADIGVGDRVERVSFPVDRGRGARIGGFLDRFFVFWLEMGGFWWELVGLRQNVSFSGQIMSASGKICRPQAKLVHLR